MIVVQLALILIENLKIVKINKVVFYGNNNDSKIWLKVALEYITSEN